MTLESYKAVTRNMPPPMQSRDVSACNTTRETEVARHLRSVSKGPFADTFLRRLSDDIAVCNRNWDHFKQSSGELPAWALRLPHELAGGTKEAVFAIPAVCAARAI